MYIINNISKRQHKIHGKSLICDRSIDYAFDELSKVELIVVKQLVLKGELRFKEIPEISGHRKVNTRPDKAASTRPSRQSQRSTKPLRIVPPPPDDSEDLVIQEQPLKLPIKEEEKDKLKDLDYAFTEEELIQEILVKPVEEVKASKKALANAGSKKKASKRGRPRKATDSPTKE